MSAQELQNRLLAGEDLLLLDIRQHQEKARWDLGGVHIPVAELHNRFREIRDFKKKRVVVFCQGTRGSIRAHNAQKILQKANFINVEVLEDGITGYFGIFQSKFPNQ